MKEATRIQIENMKNQTFGVEIEGNHITRKKAAEKAAAEAREAAERESIVWELSDRERRIIDELSKSDE